MVTKVVFWLIVVVGNHDGYNTLTETTIPHPYQTQEGCQSAASAAKLNSADNTYVWGYCIPQSVSAP